MQISDEIRYTPRSITLSLISIILHIILTVIQYLLNTKIR